MMFVHRRKEHEKHIEELLSHPNAPQLHTSMSRTRKISADSYRKMTQSPHEKGAPKASQKKPVSTNTVRFETTPTVHILEVNILNSARTFVSL